MNYRSTLLTASAAVALAGLANAQVNGPHDFNWASIHSGPAAVLFDPNFFSGGNPGNPVGIGDGLRVCYAVAVTQGGRNQTGQAFVSWFRVAQAWGGNNTTPGVDIGPLFIASQVSQAVGDDSCLSGLFIQTGTINSGGSLFLGAPGVIAGTAGTSINQGGFWNIAFEFIGTNLPSVATTAGTQGGLAGPLLAHLVFEVQGPVAEGGNNKQYWLGSTSEKNGISTAGTGGVTAGANGFGSAVYGVPAQTSSAVSGTRWTSFDAGAGLLNGGTIAFATAGDLETLHAVAFQTPYYSGANNGNTGSGNSDWRVTSAPTSVINWRVIDRLSGAQNPSSGATGVSLPGLVFNRPFHLFSATPAVSKQQLPLSWDDLGGALPSQAGSYLFPPQATTRAGSQRVHVNFDATTQLFLQFGLFGAGFTNYDGGVTPEIFDFGVGLGLAGEALWSATGIPLSTPAPGAGGFRLGSHALLLQINVLTGGALLVAETTNARTAVLQ
jgi:hypothetical protein